MFVHSKSVFPSAESEFYLSMLNMTLFFLSKPFKEIQEITLTYVSVSKL